MGGHEDAKGERDFFHRDVRITEEGYGGSPVLLADDWRSSAGYVNADGNISNEYPDFLIKLADKRVVIVETKGPEDLDVPLKMQRL